MKSKPQMVQKIRLHCSLALVLATVIHIKGQNKHSAEAPAATADLWLPDSTRAIQEREQAVTTATVT